MRIRKLAQNARHLSPAGTLQPPQRKALHFAICIRVLHNITLIDFDIRTVFNEHNI